MDRQHLTITSVFLLLLSFVVCFTNKDFQSEGDFSINVWLTWSFPDESFFRFKSNAHEKWGHLMFSIFLRVSQCAKILCFECFWTFIKNFSAHNIFSKFFWKFSPSTISLATSFISTYMSLENTITYMYNYIKRVFLDYNFPKCLSLEFIPTTNEKEWKQ